ncbi:MAG: T9SS type A sorting domain-containing protein, partial [Saprospiraceae bacterium]|nr:T9SS type A sorting domain-containing protein [Saprospiraceae bacterium]
MPGSKYILGTLFCLGMVFIGPTAGQAQCPTANPILASAEVCPGTLQELSVTFDRSATSTYAWEVVEGGSIVGSAQGASVSIQWDSNNGGPYEVKLTERQGNCFYENLMEVSIADDLARARFNCFGDINIPFDQNCEKLITPSMLMSSGPLACPDAFDVTLTIDGTNLVPNPVPLSYAGIQLIATVVHRESRRSCQTYVTLQDGTKPQLVCENDTSICLDPDIWDPFGDAWKVPSVTDNCDTSVVVRPLRSEWIDLLEDPEYTGYIRRDWSAKDKAGNEGLCSDTIWLQRIILDEMVCPSDTTILCDSFLLNPDDPTIAGSPSFNGFSLYASKHQCEYSIKYEDHKSFRCHASYIIDRTWTIKSFATGDEHTLECKQRIEVIDTVGPQITFADPRIKIQKHHDVAGLDTSRVYKTLYYPTLDFGCVAHGYLPAPTVKDNCSPIDSLTIDLIWSTGHISYGAEEEEPHLLFQDLPYGKHIVRVVARDDCHNQSKDTLIIVTEDRRAPYIVADKDPQVGLTSYSKVTWIDVANFDEGTYDNCHLLTVLGRRVDWDSTCTYTTDSTQASEVRDFYDNYYKWLQEDSTLCADSIGYGWTDQIPFCCEDACPGEPVLVELMAIDAHCNISYLWVRVFVEDKTNPEVVQRLPDLTISCKAYQEYYQHQIDSGHFDVFGTYDIGHHTYGNLYDSVTHTIVKDKICYDPPRPIFAEGPVYHDTEPIGYEFYEWIEDTIENGIVYDNCLVEIRERQKVHLEKCGQGWIERIFAIDGICSQHGDDSLVLKQRIEIVNDCPFYEQEIIWPAKDTTVYGCTAGEVITPEPMLRHFDACREIGIHFEDQATDVLYGADSVCQKIIRTWAVIDWCRQVEDYHEEWYRNQNYHYYEYEQIIYVKDTIGPSFINCDLDTLCIGTECTYDLDHTMEVSDNCTAPEDMRVAWKLFRIIPEGFHLVEEGETLQMQVTDLPVAEYKAVWTLTDKCNVSSYCTDFFSVVDCKAPTAICITSTTVKLFPIDLDQNAVIDTAIGTIWAEELNLSSHDNCDAELNDFRIRWKAESDSNPVPPDTSARKLNLGCFDVGTKAVEFWVVDSHGNASYCDVILDIQAPLGGCPERSGIEGSVRTLDGSPLQEAIVMLETEDQLETAFTDDQGQYAFSGYDMTDSPHTMRMDHDDVSIDGISTADLIQISKHILGKTTFTDPLRLKAADVNGNGDISVADLITLRKYLLGKTEQLPVADQWIFHNQLGEQVSHFSAQTMQKEHLRFRGAKVGDVNGDVAIDQNRARNQEAFVSMQYEDFDMVAEETYRIEFKLDASIAKLEGIQLALGFDPERIELIDATSNLPGFSSEHVHQFTDHVRMSWHEAVATHLDITTSVIELHVKARQATKASQSIALDGNALAPEVYHGQASTTIKLMGKMVDKQNTTHRLYPNPFKDDCLLEVTSTYEGQATLIIWDIAGRVVSQEESTMTVGTTTIPIRGDRLPSSGTYHYQLITP